MEPSVRYSRQREAVLEAVRSASDHPTAEAIYQEVRKTIPNISLGTVYRNLNFLTSEGKIREITITASVNHVAPLSTYHWILNLC